MFFLLAISSRTLLAADLFRGDTAITIVCQESDTLRILPYDA